MPLDPGIFFQGAALRQANAARTQATMDNLFNRFAAQKQRQQELEQKKSTDYEGSAYRVLMAQQAGQQPDPQDLLRAQAWDKMQTTKIAIDPLTREAYSPQRSIFDSMASTPPQPYQPQYSGFTPEDINAVMMTESGGNPLAVSPKGAEGLMQIMPDTGKSPGYGVMPLQNNTPQENMRMGADYLNAMQKTYGDKATALMAYNWGPGNVDKWIQGGRDPNAIPAETKQYVNKILNRNPMGDTKAGQMKRFETDLALGQKAEEANIEASQAGAKKRAELTEESSVSTEQRNKALKDISTNIDNLIAAAEGTPSGMIEGTAASVSSALGFPNKQAIARAKFESGKAISGLQSRIAFLKGQGTITDAEAKQAMAFIPDVDDPIEIKKAKLTEAKLFISGLVGEVPKTDTTRPGFKYLGTE